MVMIQFKRRKLMSLFIFCLLGLLWGCHQNTKSVVLQDLTGKYYSIPDPQGRWIFINYWASWCKPCHEEVPALNAFNKKFSQHVLVLGVNFDEADLSIMKEMSRKMGFLFPVLQQNPNDILSIKTIEGLPTTLVLDPSGKVIKELQGLQTEESLAAAIPKK
jgi:thiol-disulfide isomerase/thioredoxin